MAVVVPAEAVLVGEPGGRERAGAQLLGCDLRCLQGRGHHHQAMPLLFEEATSTLESVRLAGPGGSLDHEESGRARHRGKNGPLCVVERRRLGCVSGGERLLGASGERGGEAVLDREDLW